jgi:hypothetical protein
MNINYLIFLKIIVLYSNRWKPISTLCIKNATEFRILIRDDVYCYLYIYLTVAARSKA